jgi:peptide/nickel transport system permease protein
VWALVVRRLVGVVPLLVFVSAVVFVLMELVPGDPALTIAGDRATPDQVAQIRERLGLDRPLPVRYWEWVTAVLTGDLGTSLFSSQSVAGAVWGRLPVTLSLAAGSVAVAVLIGVGGGIVAAVRPGGWTDRTVTVLASLGLAIPSFWLGLLLVLLFSRTLEILPPTGYVALAVDPWQWLRSMVLPSLAPGASASAALARQTRGALVAVLQRDYVLAALARGKSWPSVVAKHGLKNAAVPVVTVLGLQVVNLIAASVIIEHVFALPGLGALAIHAVTQRDIMMLQGVVVVATLVVVGMNLLVDLLYGYLNPKVRVS